jgi:CheY-like chemotaxis protein
MNETDDRQDESGEPADGVDWPQRQPADPLPQTRGTLHELSDLLQGILEKAALSLLELPASSRVRGHLEELELSAQRAVLLLGGLLEQIRPERGGAGAALVLAPAESVTVLVVDDDETVRTVAALALRRHGLYVLTARDGHEAVEIYRERAGEIDLVVLDMMMPRMNGEQALRAMQAIRPDVCVIVTSGYSECLPQQGVGKPGGVIAFLPKPFGPSKLLAAVRESLSKRRSAE